MHIRSEAPGDIAAIEEITKAAFLEAPHTDHTEHLIVNALRDAGALAISLVAEVQGKIVGHVALSRVTISDGSQDWYGLGPISVVPERQGEGIGSALMGAALEALDNASAHGCVLLGEPEFYQRFGFAPKAGLILPGVPEAYFLACKLGGEWPQGEVSYHDAFQVRN
ncbi:GNAT family N-acetyltransferase [Shewanella loihica]|uniref:GCN5-related N-acetyltransferase n=1 Tax=Shewanella loihica (strain ATCC BAA-1088 / PV-4) TaxID=323850 RepID=A3QGS4_SHELP|nr:N-acetyltransferase [Shewanella loihica]ABO24672.1 GCN5-related N-acetyltransferase [Shewanella loihica PV-4]